MSHNQQVTFDDSFHQATFIPSLAFIQTQANLDLGPIILDEIAEDFPSLTNTQVSTLFNHYLSSYGTGIAAQTFNDWNSFKTGWYNFMTNEGYTPATTTHFYTAFLNGYMQALGNKITPDLTTITGDWSILQTPPNPLISLDFRDDSTLNNPFVKTFNHFASEYNYPIGGPFFDFRTPLFNQLSTFMTTTSLLQDPSQAVVPPGQPANFFSELSSYAAIYQAFGPSNGTPDDFIARIQQFYVNQLSAKGYFLPSQDFSEWFEEIRNENGFNMAFNPLNNSSLSGNSSEKVAIINRLILLIISMIQTLQSVGISQANRLKFTTSFQQAYVALQTQVPTFVRGSPGAIGGASSDASQVRNDLNASFNAIMIDNLRSLRGLQEDRAKQQQSDLNQTNDAVNQQTDMATTFLQELSTLLSTIMR